MSYKVGMISLGCAKNRVDAELMLAKLKESGYELVENVLDSDVAIVNTCGFIEDAKKESIEEIFNVVRLKETGKIEAIIVTGCLSERYKDQILKEIPELDAVMGIGANSGIAEVVGGVLNGKKSELFPEKEKLPLNGERVRTTPNYYAYLKVADGCDNKCTYCAIPLIRGRYRSRKMEDIISEAILLAENGVKELLVIAQDTTRYGEDIYGKLMLSALLKELCKIDNIRWIRVLYAYPDRITDELIETIANEEKILNYIDVPLQHCNGNILKLMNRHGNKETLTELINKLRAKIPGLVLRTTFMTGFPGEGEQEFEELAEFVKDIKFERMGCFAYSAEEDTPAAVMNNQVEEDVKLRRREIIMEDQMKIMEEYCKKMLGKTLTVLVEGFDEKTNHWFGRSIADSPDVDGKVLFKTDKNMPITGDFISVKVDDFTDCDLLGIAL